MGFEAKQFGTWSLVFLTLTCCSDRAFGKDPLRLQRISIYADNCCKGKSESYTSSVRDLEDVSMILAKGQMKSFSVHRGLWALSTGKNFSKPGVYYEGGHNEVDGNCGSSAAAGGGEQAEYIQYKSMRFVGNPMADLPGLSLFTGDSFLGEELYFDGTGTALRLPSPYLFKSYGFTGKESWSIFPGVNYTGGSSCLVTQNKVVSHMESAPLPLVVGSIRKGCLKKEELKQRKRPKQIQLHLHHALLLHAEKKENGEKLYTDGPELRLPIPLIFKSHSFVGLKNWTVFSHVDLSGRQICLVNFKSLHLKPGENSKTIAYQNLTVGSIKRGCDSDPVPEVITPPPEITDRQTDVSRATHLHLVGFSVQIYLYSTTFLLVILILPGLSLFRILTQ